LGYDNKGFVMDGYSEGSAWPGTMTSWPGTTWAIMHDAPGGSTKNAIRSFETFAIAKKSRTQQGLVYGGLSWGFVANNLLQLTSIARAPIDGQTQEFKDSVDGWKNQANGPLAKRNYRQTDYVQQQLGPFKDAP
jgi:hypothetical protein